MMRPAHPWLARIQRANRRCKQQHGRGFTLMELMIAVAVLGILASAAWPLYAEQVRQSQRKAAAHTLLQAQIFVHAYRAQHHHWPADSQTNPSSLPAKLRQSPPEGRASYLIELQRLPDGPGFLLVANPQGNQSQDRCGALSLKDNGQRWAAGSPGGPADLACWP